MPNITRIFEIPRYGLKNNPKENAFLTKKNKKWQSLSIQNYIKQADILSKGLLEIGIQKDDKIAVITSNNRVEWNILDIAISQIGAISVPMYPTISKEDYVYIFNNSEAKMCFVSDKLLFEKVNSIKDKTPLKEIYSFNEVENCKNWADILSLGDKNPHKYDLNQIQKSINENDLVTIIYTSGTTGFPKGVMLSHKNIVANVISGNEAIPDKIKTALSFLPCCHVFERIFLYAYQYRGISIYFSKGIDKISEELKDVKPNMVTVVPRLIEKIYDKIMTKGSELPTIKRMLFYWAVSQGEKYIPFDKMNFANRLKLKIARKLIFSKWKEVFGGNLIILFSASAALQKRLVRLFFAAEIPILEGYGLTETSPGVASTKLSKEDFKLGTVGKPLSISTIIIASNGEIMVKSPSVMLGYYKSEEQTKEVFDNKGYFHTGDIGVMKDGFLSITDRKKEIFKTSGGKYIAPQVIENKLKQSRFIEQIMVVGENEKMPCAIIQPNFEFIKKWAKRKEYDLDTTSNTQMIKDKRVISRIKKEVIKINRNLGNWERVKRIKLTDTTWSVLGKELTPTLKLKRKNIMAKYKHLYNEMYC